MRYVPVSLSLSALCVFAGASSAQDINVSFGVSPVPSSAYGAASGNAGAWNLLGFPSGAVQMLDVAGQPTSVYGQPSPMMFCDEYGCGACSGFVCPGTFGSADNEALLGSWVNADCGLSVTRYHFTGLETGRYVVHAYTYGCPSAPAASTTVNAGDFLFQFGTTGVPFQGTWTGFPYARHVLDVGPWGLDISCWGTGETGIAGMQIDKLDPVGVAGCFGDGTGGSCPCANFGQPGAGCANSSSTQGARLGALGAPSLGFDTLGFPCSFVPPGVSALLLQGDQTVGPFAFGDGLRCIGGQLKRMYLGTATAGGTLNLPANGGLSVSARSAQLGDALAAGSVRGYQLYYRDNAAAFCPAPQGSTYNISNAVEITWQP